MEAGNWIALGGLAAAVVFGTVGLLQWVLARMEDRIVSRMDRMDVRAERRYQRLKATTADILNELLKARRNDSLAV